MRRLSSAGGIRPIDSIENAAAAPKLRSLPTPDVPYIAPACAADDQRRVGTTIVALPNGREVLLPSGNGPDSFASYVRRLEKTHTFPRHRKMLRRLMNTAVETRKIDARPIVGIVVAEPGHLLRDSQNAVAKTIEAIEANGCRPVLIPPRADLAVADPHERVEPVVASLVDRLDGMIGLGGADVHPHLYGQLHRGALDTNLPRDKFEAALIRRALRSRVFMLGICRSHQLWNVVSGGTVSQDVIADGLASSTRDQRDLGIPLAKPLETKGYKNIVDVKAASRLHGLVGRSRLKTNSAHHQAVLRPGRGFTAVAHTKDPVFGTRMVAGTETDRAVTVQFHPELRGPLAPERALLDGLCRRAKIFAIVRRLESSGPDATTDAIVDAMKDGDFDLSDHRWVHEDLAMILARTQRAAA